MKKELIYLLKQIRKDVRYILTVFPNYVIVRWGSTGKILFNVLLTGVFVPIVCYQVLCVGLIKKIELRALFAHLNQRRNNIKLLYKQDIVFI